jgi:hypothetical protein
LAGSATFKFSVAGRYQTSSPALPVGVLDGGV